MELKLMIYALERVGTLSFWWRKQAILQSRITLIRAPG